MVYDLNAYYDQVKNSSNAEKRHYFHDKLVDAKYEFLHEWREFMLTYDQEGYSCKINVDYLKEIQSTLLSGELYVPRSMLEYMKDELGIEVDIFNLTKIYRKKKWQQSVWSTGGKIINPRYGPGNTKFLLFEVYEFTLTYPQYKDLFIEERK